MSATKIIAASAIVATASAFAPVGSFQPRLRSNGVSNLAMKQFPFDSKVAKAIGDAVPLPPVQSSESYAFTTSGGASPAAAASSSAPRSAPRSSGGKGKKNAVAPVITVFDHRGCQRGGPDREYTGKKANGPDDEMCVKVKAEKIQVSDTTASAVLQQSLGILMTRK
mmetsp:Transcript_10585/g.22672  ORF Transcript_10585/g.22672 Transcript_10585/m.22672 type:complete len:167 (-) Transcript_10585:180-680(-)